MKITATVTISCEPDFLDFLMRDMSGEGDNPEDVLIALEDLLDDGETSIDEVRELIRERFNR